MTSRKQASVFQSLLPSAWLSRPAPAQPAPRAMGRVLPWRTISPGCSDVVLRYLRTSPIRIRGAATGREYDFSACGPVAIVDQRDLPSLLGTGYFERA
jgi:hypothetical protein